MFTLVRQLLDNGYISGSENIFSNDFPVVRQGDSKSDGSVASTFSENVFMNDLGVHRQSDTASNGVISESGSENVFVN